MSTQPLSSVDNFNANTTLGLARSTDPSTSHEAAAQVDTSRLEKLIVKALTVCKDGLTSDELSSFIGEDLNTLTPRLKPLRTKNLIEIAPAKRKSFKGRNVNVWILKRKVA